MVVITRIASGAVVGLLVVVAHAPGGAAGAAEGQSPGVLRLDADTVRRIDAVFAQWDTTRSPGCALGISRQGDTVYQRGYGMSNLEYDIAISPQSIFHVASISKQFTAFAVALLASDAKLSLDDDVRKHLPELPDFGRRISIRHLMHHTSGLRDQWTLQRYAGWRDDDLITEDDVLRMAARQRALNFDPGAEYLYSNTGFTLLAVIVKRVSGLSLREFAEARIFGPLGMTQTHFHNDHTMIVRHRTSAYQPRTGGGWSISLPVFDTDGATSLFTTVGDLLRWEQNLVDGRVGGRALVEQAQTSGTLNDGSSIGYGWGLTINTYRGVRVIGHAGADAGYRSDVLRFPDHGLAIAAFCNLSTIAPGDLTRQVADVLLPSSALAPWPSAVLTEGAAGADRAGTYWNSLTDDVRRVVFVDGALRAAPGAPAWVPLGGGRYRQGERGGELLFPRGASASAQELHVLTPPLAPAVFRKLPPFSGAMNLRVFEGRYRSADLGATYEVASNGKALVVKRPRIADLVLEQIGPEMFTTMSGSPTVTFVRSNGTITGLTLSMGRVRRLPFSRAVAGE